MLVITTPTLEGHPISREGFIAAWQDVEPYIRMVDELRRHPESPVVLD